MFSAQNGKLSVPLAERERAVPAEPSPWTKETADPVQGGGGVELKLSWAFRSTRGSIWSHGWGAAVTSEASADERDLGAELLIHLVLICFVAKERSFLFWDL